MRHVVGFDLAHRFGEAHLLRARERGHFDKFPLLPEKPPAAGTEFVKHRIEQTWRRRNCAKRCEGDVDFVDAVKLVSPAPGHQVGNAWRRAATEADRYAGFSRFFIKLKLFWCIEESAKIKIVNPGVDSRASYDQTKMISRAVSNHVKPAHDFAQSNFIASVSLPCAHATATKLRCECLRSVQISIGDHNLVKIACLDQIACRLASHRATAAEYDYSHSSLLVTPSLTCLLELGVNESGEAYDLQCAPR